jgi:hypothetical protein
MVTVMPLLALLLLLLLMFDVPTAAAEPVHARDEPNRQNERAATLAFDPSKGDLDAHRTSHLGALSRALAAHGAFRVVSGRAGEIGGGGSGGGDEADVVWEFEPDAAPRTLRRGQKTNHFPGMEKLTSKTGLAELLKVEPSPPPSSPSTTTLASLVPITLAPGVSSPEDVVTAAAATAGRDGAWLVKHPSHGGVRVLRRTTERSTDGDKWDKHEVDPKDRDGGTIPPAPTPTVTATTISTAATAAGLIRDALAAGDVVQRRVTRPLRVDGRAFDLGMYVLVLGKGLSAPPHQCFGASQRCDEVHAGSWHALAFDEVLLRFTGGIERGGAALNASDTRVEFDAVAAGNDLVGHVYTAAWDIPSLRALGAGGAGVRDGPTAWTALARYLDGGQIGERERDSTGRLAWDEARERGGDEGKDLKRVLGVGGDGEVRHRDGGRGAEGKERSGGSGTYGDSAGSRLRRDMLAAVAAALDASAPSVAAAIIAGAARGDTSGGGPYGRGISGGGGEGMGIGRSSEPTAGGAANDSYAAQTSTPPSYPDGAGHFFELLRFDFVVEVEQVDAKKSAVASVGKAGEKVAPNEGMPGGETPGSSVSAHSLRLKPWLIEVNASPNVKPSSPQQGDVLARLCAAVASKIADAAVPASTSTSVSASLPQAANNDNGGTGFEHLALSASGALFAPPQARNAASVAAAMSTTTATRGGSYNVDSSPGAAVIAAWRGPHRSLAEHADVDCQMSTWGPYSSCTAARTPACAH